MHHLETKNILLLWNKVITIFMVIFLFLQKISRKRWMVIASDLFRSWSPMFDEHTITFLHLHERTNCAGCVFSIILRIVTLAFSIYIIHGNLDINGNTSYIVCFIGFRWSSTTSLLCLFGKASLHINIWCITIDI
jgi:heme/copper-type cytochrome/quinol oxidase subunit 4